MEIFQPRNLELKTDSKLNLPFSEEKAIREIAWRSERWIEIGIYVRTGSRNPIHSVVDASNLCTVEDIKALCKQFDLGVFMNRKAT